MARAYGSNAQLLFKYEAAYGQDPGGNFQQLPFKSADLGAEQGLVENDIIGQGRDPLAPSRDLVRVGGQITVPLDVRNIGFWFKLIFGDPTTTGVGPYTHTFVSGGSSLPSAAIEIAFPEVPAYFLNLGCMGDSIRVELSRSGGADAVIQLAGQDEQKFAASQGGTPVAPLALSRFNQVQGNIQRNGVNLGNITSASAEYRNSLEAVETIRPDQLVEAQDATIAAFSGSIETRFASTTLYDDAKSGAAIDVDLIYTIDAANTLTISGQEIYLPQSKPRLDGPGGVSASYDFQGAKDTVEGEMVEVELINDVADYTIV